MARQIRNTLIYMLISDLANARLLKLSRQFARDLLSRHVVDRVDLTAQFQGNQGIWLKLAPSVALPPS
jgi:hypothetical protein